MIAQKYLAQKSSVLVHIDDGVRNVFLSRYLGNRKRWEFSVQILVLSNHARIGFRIKGIRVLAKRLGGFWLINFSLLGLGCSRCSKVSQISENSCGASFKCWCATCPNGSRRSPTKFPWSFKFSRPTPTSCPNISNGALCSTNCFSAILFGSPTALQCRIQSLTIFKVQIENFFALLL